MKIKFLLLALVLCAFSTVTFAQSVVITPKKTVYTRKISGIDPEKKTFQVRYPIVSGTITPAAKKTLENTLSYWRAFSTSLKNSQTEDTSLLSLDYKVNYNKNGVLDISLISETMAAYPDTHTVNLVIDTKTGKAVGFKDAFAPNSLSKLAALADKKLAVEKREIIKSIDADKESYSDAEGRDYAKQQVSDLQFTTESFNEFSVGDKGVTILYDAGFPHVIQALQPEGRYFFTWAEIKPFIKPNGVLSRLMR